MKTQSKRQGQPGFVSYVLVISTSLVLTLITFYAYKVAIDAKEIQGTVQLKVDYTEKEDAVLRSIVAITPNRAMRAMMANSYSNTTVRESLRWKNILNDALTMANARTSVPPELLQSVAGTDTVMSANVGDSAIARPNTVFHPISGVNDDQDTSYMSSGINRSLGEGFPVPLQTTNPTISDRDRIYPIISYEKAYGSLAEGQVGLPTSMYPQYNLIPYPDINFGYASPGQPFVAKRNWWAFEMGLGNADSESTHFYRPNRTFVVSIYEVPSQLSISAASFMALGRHADGEKWDANVNIEGNVFAGRAEVDGPVALEGLSSRREMRFNDSSAAIGGMNFLSNPFEAGLREEYQITTGESYPVSLASESGRVSFIPINRGAVYFDRFAHTAETDTISPTPWNQYSIGALQCAMKLDIVEVDATTKMPTKLRFQAKPSIDITYDVPNPAGNLPFGITLLGSDQRMCVEVMPELFPAYLQSIGASDTSVNHSLVVNVDYRKPNLSNPMRNGHYIDKITESPLLLNYGLILRQCSDLTGFVRGFSLVSNLRAYIGDDFNTVPAASPPADYPVPGDFYPPVSLYVPEKRFGVEEDPYQITLAGQIGSLASENALDPVRPLDTKTVTERTMEGSKIEVNLTPIVHPAALPPITMMNWLVLIEELRDEHMAEYRQTTAQ